MLDAERAHEAEQALFLLSSDYLESWRQKTANIPGTMAPSRAPDPQIPHHLVQALLRSRGTHQVLSQLSQLCTAVFDMTVHTPESHQAIREMNISLTPTIAFDEKSSPPRAPGFLGEGDEWGHNYVRQRNWVGSDYDAGYYSYLSVSI